MLKRLFVILILFAGFTACENEKLPVEFLDINDAGIATFTIENETEQDVAAFAVELTYLSEDKQILRVDTVVYGFLNKSEAFIKAGKQTYFGQNVAEGTASAKGRVLNYKFMD